MKIQLKAWVTLIWSRRFSNRAPCIGSVQDHGNFNHILLLSSLLHYKFNGFSLKPPQQQWKPHYHHDFMFAAEDAYMRRCIHELCFLKFSFSLKCFSPSASKSGSKYFACLMKMKSSWCWMGNPYDVISHHWWQHIFSYCLSSNSDNVLRLLITWCDWRQHLDSTRWWKDDGENDNVLTNASLVKEFKAIVCR